MVPLATALGIAVLYGAGAIVKAGQLRGEGFAIRDTLPLVPLEQLLALGIGIVVSSLLWLLGIAVLFSVYLRFTWLWEPPKQRITVGRRVKQGINIVPWVVFPLLGIWLLSDEPINFAIPLLLGAMLPTFLQDYGAKGGRRYVSYVLAVYFIALVLVKMVSAYYWPTRLAWADVTTTTAEQWSGPLVAATGSTYYIGRGIEGNMRAIPAQRVAYVRMRSREADPDREPVLRPVWERIFG